MSYPNMSYCMCENTLLALQQVLSAMKDEGPQFLIDMNKQELRAFKELFNACEDFLNASEDLEDELNKESEFDEDKTREFFD